MGARNGVRDATMIGHWTGSSDARDRRHAMTNVDLGTAGEVNLFYAEPDPDRWLPLDRHPRRLIRRMVRGPTRPGGYGRTFLNLCAGLDRLGVSYRVNNYGYSPRNPNALVCIVGTPCLLNPSCENPIRLGPATHSHPLADPTLLPRL